jgi:hypothetical protein
LHLGHSGGEAEPSGAHDVQDSRSMLRVSHCSSQGTITVSPLWSRMFCCKLRPFSTSP